MNNFERMCERDVLIELCEEYLNLFVRPYNDIDFERTEGTTNEYCASNLNVRFRKGFVEIGLNNLNEEKQINNVIKDRGLSDLEFPLLDTHRIFSMFHEIGHIKDMDVFDEEEMMNFSYEKMSLMFSNSFSKEEKERRYRMVGNEKSADDYAEACLKDDSIREFVKEFLENKKKARGL